MKKRPQIDECLVDLLAAWEVSLEQDKKTVARELHDGLGQLLTALRLDISLFKLQHQENGELVDKADNMLLLTDRSMQAACRLMTELRSSILDTNIISSLEWFCRNLSNQHGLQCTLNVSEDCSLPEGARATVLFRILREALNYAVSHKPTAIDIGFTQLADADGAIRLQVKIDHDGDGFDPELTAEKNDTVLSVMRNGTVALGGQIEISDANKRRTTMLLIFPV